MFRPYGPNCLPFVLRSFSAFECIRLVDCGGGDSSALSPSLFLQGSCLLGITWSPSHRWYQELGPGFQKTVLDRTEPNRKRLVRLGLRAQVQAFWYWVISEYHDTKLRRLIPASKGGLDFLVTFVDYERILLNRHGTTLDRLKNYKPRHKRAVASV